jgi:hypothetical protein
VTVSVASHLGTVPQPLADALDKTFGSVMEHYLKTEWDDAQVDAGRFCEAALRYLEWKMTGNYTPIDGKRKPNRKTTVAQAINDTSLPPSLRAQMPQGIELVMDFRNNRNVAHLGAIDANKMDANCVVQNVNWIVGEIVRVEANRPVAEIQHLLDQLAERHIPLVQVVKGRPVMLRPEMQASEKALILLYQQAKAVPIGVLREWVGYGNATRWRKVVLADLEKRALVHIDDEGEVMLLHPGEAEAQRLVLAAGGL